MKTGFLITARMKSTRLSKKLTLEIEGRQVIRWMIDRLKLNKAIDEIVICTSTNSQDDALAEIAAEENIKVFRGSEEDVIGRLYEAAKANNLDYVINITADCPLVSNSYISEIIKTYQATNADLVRTLDLPHGFFSYGLKVAAMKKVCDIKSSENTEVWGRYFEETGMKVVDVEIPDSLKREHFRLTLDYPEDFEFFKAVYKYFGADTYKTNMLDIIDFLDQHPEVVAKNEHCGVKYRQRWEAQNKLELK
jgi:spore coat polysaccharide biosynthesis protein SpsF